MVTDPARDTAAQVDTATLDPETGADAGDSTWGFERSNPPRFSPPLANGALNLKVEGIALGDRPVRTTTSAYVVPKVCPGEYCSYGGWALNRAVTLRSEPSGSADSVGYVPARHMMCADSGLIVIDPGIVVITASPQLEGEVFQHAYVPGDTLTVFYPTGEGYWVVQYRDSLFLTYESWNATGDHGARVVRRGRNYFWVHMTDRASGQRGWVFSDGWHTLHDFQTPPCP